MLLNQGKNINLVENERFSNDTTRKLNDLGNVINELNLF